MRLLIAVLPAFGQNAVVPIFDSITLSYAQRGKGNYGSICLYGAFELALAVLVAEKQQNVSKQPKYKGGI